MKKKKTCPTCDAPIMEHRHTLSLGLLRGLQKIGEQGGPFPLNQLGLTYNQQCNFQKLRYWGLVTKCYDPDGQRNNGYWSITLLGKEFLKGHVTVARQVWTYRGSFVRFDGEVVHVSDVIEKTFKRRPMYAAEAQPHPTYEFDEGGQGSLL